MAFGELMSFCCYQEWALSTLSKSIRYEYFTNEDYYVCFPHASYAASSNAFFLSNRNFLYFP